MKTQRTYLRRPSAVAAFALIALVAAPQAIVADGQRPATYNRNNDSQSQGGWSESALSAAPENAEERGLENIARTDVRSADGKRIGRIRDVLVDPDSGKIEYAIVSTGGLLGLGRTMHLVRFDSLEYSAGDQVFSAPFQDADWRNLPTIRMDDFERGMITISEEHRRRLDTVSRSNAAVAPAGGPDKPLLRGSHLDDKPLQVAGREIGEIEDVIIDFDSHTAMALVEVDEDFAGSEQSFLVPLRQLDLRGGEKDAISTTLNAADFQRATSSTTNLAASTKASDIPARARDADVRGDFKSGREERLTPTGRTEIDPVLESAARSVRQIWERDRELAKYGLRVTPTERGLLFEGTVPNADLWERAKDEAEGVLSRIHIDNRITIRAE